MKAAVVGSPISHSLSPALHRAAYRRLGLADWTYEAVDCTPGQLPDLLAGCGPDWAGLSLTMPLKRAVLPLLDEADSLVTEVGCANTVVFAGGRRRGCNTDVAGMVTALTEARVAANWTRADALHDALILGGGATACAALAAVRALGLTGATAAVRSQARADGLTAAARRLGMTVTLVTFGAVRMRGGELLISALPAGAADGLAERLWLPRRVPAVLLDVVYDPWPTRLAAAAAGAGAVVVDGFEMLLHQAAAQVALMTGRAAPVAAMREAGLAARAS